MSYYEIFFGIGVVSMLVGAAFTFYGWRLHRLLIAVDGFVVGGVVGFVLGSTTLDYGYYDSLSVYFVIGGIIGAGFFLMLEKIAVGCSIGSIGAAIMGEATKTQYLEGYWWGIPQYTTEYNNIAIIIGFIIFAYVGWKFYKYAYIFLTSASGSLLIAAGGVLSGFWNVDSAWLIALVLFLVGIFIQYQNEQTVTSNRRENNNKKRSHKRREIEISKPELKIKPDLIIEDEENEK